MGTAFCPKCSIRRYLWNPPLIYYHSKYNARCHVRRLQDARTGTTLHSQMRRHPYGALRHTFPGAQRDPPSCARATYLVLSELQTMELCSFGLEACEHDAKAILNDESTVALFPAPSLVLFSSTPSCGELRQHWRTRPVCLIGKYSSNGPHSCS